MRIFFHDLPVWCQKIIPVINRDNFKHACTTLMHEVRRSEETKDSPVLSFLVDRWWRWGGAVWRGGEELRGLRWCGGTAWWGVVGGAVVGTTGRWPVARPVKLNVTLPQTTMQLSPWRSKHREPNHFIILHGFSTVKHSYSERL